MLNVDIPSCDVNGDKAAVLEVCLFRKDLACYQYMKDERQALQLTSDIDELDIVPAYHKMSVDDCSYSVGPTRWCLNSILVVAEFQKEIVWSNPWLCTSKGSVNLCE